MIGIFGSAVDESAQAMNAAAELGKIIATESKKVILATGACPGIPFQVAHAAKKANFALRVIGFSPEVTRKDAQAFAKHDLNLYSTVHLLPKTLPFIDDPLVRKKFRNVFLTANCQAGIVVAGRWGTLNEFSNMFDMGKVIGVLTGTGGASDELPGLYKKIHKPSKAKVFFDSSPRELLSHILEELEKSS